MPAINVEGSIKEKRNLKRGLKRGWIAAMVILITLASVGGIMAYMYGMRDKDVPIPNILGQEEQVAQDMLKAEGLLMEVASRPNSDDYPKGIVINTYPEVGMPVKKNSIVKVTISAGPRNVKVPDVVGLSLTDAEFRLKERGLEVGETEYVDNEELEKDKVLKQSPEENVEVAYGSKVKLYLSNGPKVEHTNVPLLEGISFEMVEDRLKEEGLILGTVGTRRDITKPDKVVLFQSIPQGTQVPKGTEVNIIVNDLSQVPATS